MKSQANLSWVASLLISVGAHGYVGYFLPWKDNAFQAATSLPPTPPTLLVQILAVQAPKAPTQVEPTQGASLRALAPENISLASADSLNFMSSNAAPTPKTPEEKKSKAIPSEILGKKNHPPPKTLKNPAQNPGNSHDKKPSKHARQTVNHTTEKNLAKTLNGAKNVSRNVQHIPARLPHQLDYCYPKRSRDRGESGTTQLEFIVNIDGSTSHIRIIHSSGFTSLDTCALKSIQKARFIPAKRQDKPYASTIRWRIHFRLTD